MTERPVESAGEECVARPRMFGPPAVHEPVEGVLEVRWSEPVFPVLAGLLLLVVIATGVSVGLSRPPWEVWPIALILLAAMVAGAVALYRARRRLVRVDGNGLLETRPGSPFGTRAAAWDAVEQVTLQRARGPQWMLRLHEGRRIRLVLLDTASLEPVRRSVEHWTGRPVRQIASPWDDSERRGLRGDRRRG